MYLKKLLGVLSHYKVFGPTDIEISALVEDSRRARKGSLFVAVPGLNVDGHKFIPQAIKNGAVAIVGEQDPKSLKLSQKTYIRVKNARQTLGFLASAWFGNPSQKLKIIGVTGTDGKTTTVNLIYAILKEAGKKVGMISTVNAKIGNKTYDTGFHVTSPDAIPLQAFLAKMVKEGMEYAVLEVTSHALAQYRMAGVKFLGGVLTNITYDHFDYHKTFTAYKKAKAGLFRKVQFGILNKDDKSFEFVKKYLPRKSRVVSYGINASADFQAKDVNLTLKGTSFTIKNRKNLIPGKTNLLGEYNVSNTLAAIAACRSLQIPWASIQKAVSKFKPPVGRLEKVETKKPFSIYVDFAHTPNSLKNVLTALHRLKKPNGRLIVVFGCPGERYIGKRPMMGKIATTIADISIFTADDPRSENINKIIDQIASGAENKNYIREPERGRAIKRAVDMAKSGDIIALCGKGHEKSMAYPNGVEYPWSDKEAALAALQGKIKFVTGKNKRSLS